MLNLFDSFFFFKFLIKMESAAQLIKVGGSHLWVY